MDLGRISQIGTPTDLYNRPHDVFVARLLGPTNLLQGQVESLAADARGEVVVRTPLGRLIGQMIMRQAPQGAPVTISIRPETVLTGSSDPVGLEPVSRHGRADHVQGRAAAVSGARAGRLADRRRRDPEPVATRAGGPEPHAGGGTRARRRLARQICGRHHPVNSSGVDNNAWFRAGVIDARLRIADEDVTTSRLKSHINAFVRQGISPIVNVTNFAFKWISHRMLELMAKRPNQGGLGICVEF